MSSSSCVVLSLRPLIPLNVFLDKSHLPSIIQTRQQLTKPLTYSICCSNDNNGQQLQESSSTQQLNLSVLRFTFGIPGLDESYLPRWIGYAFGSLLLLNHFLGSDLSTVTPAQLRTEILGLSLAAFSIFVPYLGKFLKGATTVTEKNVPEDTEQIFAMSQNISDSLKEDLAWGTYILLRNTNTISVLISIQDSLCVRGYWNVDKDISKDESLELFKKQIQRTGFYKLEGTLYFPQPEDSEVREILPKGTRSLLVQPLLSSDGKERNKGFLILASATEYAYSEKDRAWIGAIANKFLGK